MRPTLVLVHRYAGLLMACFLLLAGLTGALLAWFRPLDTAFNAQIFKARAPSAWAQELPPLELRERVLAQYPGASVVWMPLRHAPGETMTVPVRGAVHPAGTPHAGLEVDEVFVNPYTGAVQGARKWGDLAQGMTNLMPFIYRLHYSLALDTAGTLLLGIVSLVWTLDCFIGAWLTFPARRAGWASWWRAWKVRAGSGNYKLHFDLHRAGGLWLWAMLFVLAWSGVAFNLTEEVYRPVMSKLFTVQSSPYLTVPNLAKAEAEPAMGWSAGLALGRRHMAALAQEKGFVVQAEEAISYVPNKRFFRFTVKSDRDIRDQAGTTSVYFDARTGTRIASQLPTGETSGDTVTMWLLTLHIGHIWGTPYRIFLSCVGIAVAMLSVTGIYLWWRKRRARRVAAVNQPGRLTALS